MPETTRKPLSWFRINPQIRLTLGSESDLRNLGESLKKRQLAPVGALADGELIYGFRRLRAAQLVGLSDLAVTIYTERLTSTEIKIVQITENLHRLDMTAYEKWHAYEELRQLNLTWTAKELAEHLRLDPSVVTKWMSPSKCIPAWQDALKAGRVGITDCYHASQLAKEEQQALLDLKLSGATRDKLERVVRQSKPKSNPRKRAGRLTRITIPLSCGTKIVISGAKFSLSDVIAKLVECLEAARKGVKQNLDAKTWQNVMRGKAEASLGIEIDV